VWGGVRSNARPHERERMRTHACVHTRERCLGVLSVCIYTKRESRADPSEKKTSPKRQERRRALSVAPATVDRRLSGSFRHQTTVSLHGPGIANKLHTQNTRLSALHHTITHPATVTDLYQHVAHVTCKIQICYMLKHLHICARGRRPYGERGAGSPT